MMKRAMDVVGAGIGLVLVSPLLLAAAVAVRLGSRGPVVFRQERIGRDQLPFTVLKLRTMVAGAPSALHEDYIRELAEGGAPVGLKKLTGDPRVTRVGRILRALSIDELPQLVNVLRGEMSLVGPRPALPYELEHYAPQHFERFGVRPGLTGLWQVSGRARLGFLEMLDLDVEYARTGSLRRDLEILLRTPPALLGRTA